MDSKEIKEDLINKISAFNSYNKKIKTHYNKKDKIPSGIDLNSLSNLLIKLYKNSLEDNYYFFDCPLAVYKNTLNSRFSSYKAEIIDAEKKDFLIDELKKLYKPQQNRNFSGVDYDFLCDKVKQFETSTLKKKEYLKQELKKFKVLVDNEPIFSDSPYAEIPLDNEITFKDKNGFEILTTNQLVILLDKIGFFTHSKIESKSLVFKARLINKISGANVDNIKDYVNKLDKSESANGDNYTKDLNYIDSLLDDV